MPVQIVVRIALDIARGLHAAHELALDGRALGVVHRDLSPQNVMVGFDGSVRLTDFGIAKAFGRTTRTATGVIKGKMSYLSPEQLLHQEPDRRSDLFALGIVVFEMLSGERLYRKADGEDGLRAILEDPPPDIGELRGDVPDDLVRLLFELLAKKKEARPHDAQEVANRLEATLGELIAHEAPASVAEYVELVAGDTKREQARALSAAMESFEQEPALTPITGARRASRTARRAAVGALVIAATGAMVAVGMWSTGAIDGGAIDDGATRGAGSTSGAAPASTPATSIANIGTTGTTARGESVGGAAVGGEAREDDGPLRDRAGDGELPGVEATIGAGLGEPASAGASDSAELGGAVEAAPGARRSDARRNARRRRVARDRASAPDRSGAQIPDWVEFER
jgi:hypothetical protein